MITQTIADLLGVSTPVFIIEDLGDCIAFKWDNGVWYYAKTAYSIPDPQAVEWTRFNDVAQGILDTWAKDPRIPGPTWSRRMKEFREKGLRL